MKCLFFLAFTLCSFQLFAENGDAFPGLGDVSEQSNSGSYGQIEESENDVFAKLRETEPVKSNYDSCLAERKKDPSSFNSKYKDDAGKDAAGLGIGDCIWSKMGVSDREKVQDQIEYLDQQEEGDRQPSSEDGGNSRKYDGVALVNTTQKTLDGADKKVQEFFAKKIIDNLYGDKSKNPNEVKVVGHENFYNLYEARLSKNILETISSFCLEALPVGESKKYHGFVIPHSDDPKTDSQLKEKVRDWNKKNLSDSSDGVNLANQIWQSCLTKINDVCTEKITFCAVTLKKGEPCPPGKIRKKEPLSAQFYDKNGNGIINFKFKQGDAPILRIIDNKDIFQGLEDKFDVEKSAELTMGKACTVSQYLKGSRQTLMSINKLKNKLEESKDTSAIKLETSACSEISAKGCKTNAEVKAYKSDDEKSGINAITSLTSNEAVKASGMEDANKGLIEEVERCKQGDETACKKFLATNKNEQEELLAEYEIRTKAMEAKLDPKKMKKEDVTQYLKEEGYDDAVIEQYLGDATKLEQLKDEIHDKYKNFRKNLIDEMKRKVESKTTGEDGKYDRAKDQAKIDTIAEEITQKTTRYKDLVHFNNIVSGYLQVGEGKDAKRNTASLFSEIEDLDSDDPNAANTAGAIKQAATEAGVSAEREDESHETSYLGVETINEHILDYGEMQE